LGTFLHRNAGSGQRAHGGHGGHGFCRGHTAASGHLGQMGGTIEDFSAYKCSFSSKCSRRRGPIPSLIFNPKAEKIITNKNAIRRCDKRTFILYTFEKKDLSKSILMPSKTWSDQQEQLLITWAEKASGYAWLHQRSIKLFKRRNLYLSIPATIFGYVAGVTILLSNDVFSDCSHLFNRAWLRGCIGTIALMAGLFSNFQEIYSFKEESEKHRIAHLRFMAFFREISCIVTTAPKYRATSADFITMKRLEFDKILEQSPDIPQCIITAFNHTFRNLSIHKPDAVIGLQTIIPYGKQFKLQPYCRTLSGDDKILLIRYFYCWRALCPVIQSDPDDPDSTLLEITNSYNSSSSLEFEDPSICCSERDKSYLLVHGLLSEQRRIICGQNIKIKRNPMEIDLEKGEK